MEFKENIDGLLADFKLGRFIYGEGCLGLFGLASYTTERPTREIGVMLARSSQFTGFRN